MDYLSIDHLIVYAFLLTTLVIGLRAGHGIKDIREYVLANKQYSTGVLVLTWLATDIAGETVLDMTGSVRTVGLLQPLAVFGGWSIAMFMQALFFAPKTVHSPNCLTMGDIMGQLYKGPSQVITGILGFFNALCIAGMELTVLGLLCEGMLGIDYRWAVGIGGALLVLYATHGGIKAITLTDVFQFLTLLIVLPMITVAALKEAGGIKHVFLQVPATQFQIFTHPKVPHYLALFLTISVFQFSVIDPALMQRMLMGKTPKQLRNQFLIIAVFVLVFMVAIMFMGLASILLYPQDTDLPIVLRIVNGILPAGIKGLAIAGLFAVTMATADSFLHAAGLTLVHDVIKPSLDQRSRNALNELSWIRYTTIFVGALAIAIGIARAQDLYNFVLISYQFTGPLLAFPLFAGIIGLQPDRYAFYIASAGTLLIFALTKFLLPEAYSYMTALISVSANGILFLGTHFVRNKGFVMVNRKAYEYEASN